MQTHEEIKKRSMYTRGEGLTRIQASPSFFEEVGRTVNHRRGEPEGRQEGKWIRSTSHLGGRGAVGLASPLSQSSPLPKPPCVDIQTAESHNSLKESKASSRNTKAPTPFLHRLPKIVTILFKTAFDACAINSLARVRHGGRFWQRRREPLREQYG